MTNKNIIIMNIGEKIRQIRLMQGYSQENMADMLGISTTAYGDIERNKTELTILRASEIAKTLNISILDLLETELLLHLTPAFSSEERDKKSIEKLENEKLKAEVEKWQMTAAYWHEKYENRFVGNTMRVISEEPERRKIGF
jgi:XRE family transcriptional regulator, regulator of sulfur utilization